MAPLTPVASSAPGKVLIVGGYLVLERPHFGLVLSSAARFYAAAQPLARSSPRPVENAADRNSTGHTPGTAEGDAEGHFPESEEREGEGGAESLRVVVRSPQMQSAYTFRVLLPSLAISLESPSAEGRGDGTGTAPPSRNPFVERAVQLALALAVTQRRKCGQMKGAPSDRDAAGELVSQGLELVLLGDNDFYSHRHTLRALGLSPSPASLASIPRFSAIVKPPAATSGAPGHSGALDDAGALGHAGAPGAALEGAKAAVAAKVEKTGLGSSAAMTAAVCAALLTYWGVVGAEPTGSETALVHRVAQAAHCFGQGKVGSGFDIAAAIFGPVKYIRFSPACLEPLMVRRRVPTALPRDVSASKALLVQSLTAATEEGAGKANEKGAQDPEWRRLATALWGTEGGREDRGREGSIIGDEFWDYEVTPFALPPGLHLVVGETGGGGTSTPSMLSAIKKWRAERQEEAAATWQRLASANADVADSLQRLQALCAADPVGYRDAVTLCATTRPAEWGDRPDPPPAPLEQGAGEGAAQGPSEETVKNLLQARVAFQEVRALLQLISRSAQVPIEPPQQTEMLDETMALPGVLLSGVPGAGGYDAIFAVALGEGAVGRVAEHWSQHNVVPLGSGVSDSSLQTQSRGILSVDVTTLAPWLVPNLISC